MNNIDMNQLMLKAQEMQAELQKAQAAAKDKTVEGSAGGGMVTAVVSGGMELRSLKIDAAAVDPKDVSMLQDLIVVAVNQALGRAQEMAAGEMRALTSGLNLPGLF